MQAFTLYHPDESTNDELKKEFIKLRTSRINYVRSLHRKNVISEANLDELIGVINTCNIQELDDIFSDLKNISLEGINIERIRSKIIPKANVPIYRKRSEPDISMIFPSSNGMPKKALTSRNQWMTWDNSKNKWVPMDKQSGKLQHQLPAPITGTNYRHQLPTSIISINY